MYKLKQVKEIECQQIYKLKHRSNYQLKPLK